MHLVFLSHWENWICSLTFQKFISFFLFLFLILYLFIKKKKKKWELLCREGVKSEEKRPEVFALGKPQFRRIIIMLINTAAAGFLIFLFFPLKYPNYQILFLLIYSIISTHMPSLFLSHSLHSPSFKTTPSFYFSFPPSFSTFFIFFYYY